ncbi:uncharacterized protein LOC121415884 [Lytechinus variegatus]|uniref:uncharacterized protein LOC121415884 n=1 Tax=Lytechinus variegatus TaxID=7654 RepID=UPI001BB1D0E4|nr:uncharacterized protein LOC121415884 [Lytechinus variegatus]
MAGEPRKRGRNVITGRMKNEENFTREHPGINHDNGKASVIQLQREIKALKEENAKLQKDSVKSIYDQLVSEGPVEQYGERRVNLLKSQVIQLERQVLMQAEALSSRSGVLFEVENNLQTIADNFRELLSNETKGPSVQVQRSQLTTMIETVESARLRLYKNLEINNQEKLEQPLIFTGLYAKTKPHRYDNKPVDIMDVCSGKIEHLNLKHIAKLESKLFTLNQQLKTLHQTLKTCWSPDCHALQQLTNQHLPSAVNQRLSSLLKHAERQLVECCQDLVSLSILVPAAPWPLLSKSVIPEIKIDDVMTALPTFPRNKQQQVKSVIDAVIKASNYSRRVSKMEAKACVEELRFHQALYDVQFKYMDSLYAAVREAYMMFEDSIQKTLCDPMKEVMSSFERLKQTASEEALREFLTSFKLHKSQLETAVEGLTQTRGQGAEAISEHGDQFLDAVKAVAEKTAKERDRLAEELEEVKRMRDQHLMEGMEVLRVAKPEEESAGNGSEAMDNREKKS